MIISGYSLSVSWQYAQFYAQIGSQEVAAPIEESASETPLETASEPDSDVEQTEEGKIRGENGVLRLLQEGHFKPHAEMRLMEIFHRDLAILQAQNADIAPPDPNSAEAETI
jgi:hypothetical protein